MSNYTNVKQSAELLCETRQTVGQTVQNNRHPIERTVNTTKFLWNLITIRQYQIDMTDNKIKRALGLLERSIQTNGFSARQDIIFGHVRGTKQTTEQLRAEGCSKCQPDTPAHGTAGTWYGKFAAITWVALTLTDYPSWLRALTLQQQMVVHLSVGGTNPTGLTYEWGVKWEEIGRVG